MTETNVSYEMNAVETSVVDRVDQLISEVDAKIAERAVVLDAHVVAAKENHARVVNECDSLMSEARAATTVLLTKEIV